MTVRADRLIKRAKIPDQAGSVRSSHPAGSVRVFVHALERLDYRMEPLLTNAGIRRADLDDPDARIPRREIVTRLLIAVFSDDSHQPFFGELRSGSSKIGSAKTTMR